MNTDKTTSSTAGYCPTCGKKVYGTHTCPNVLPTGTYTVTIGPTNVQMINGKLDHIIELLERLMKGSK